MRSFVYSFDYQPQTYYFLVGAPCPSPLLCFAAATAAASANRRWDTAECCWMLTAGLQQC